MWSKSFSHLYPVFVVDWAEFCSWFFFSLKAEEIGVPWANSTACRVVFKLWCCFQWNYICWVSVCVQGMWYMCLLFLYVLFQIRLGELLLLEVSLLNASNGTARFTCSVLACNSEGSETWVLTNLNVQHFLKSAFVERCSVLWDFPCRGMENTGIAERRDKGGILQGR